VKGLAALAATALAAAGLAACGGGGSESRAPEIPPRAVAVIGDRAITPNEIEQQVAYLRRADPGGPKGEALRQRALARLLETSAYEQEARERGLEVKRADVLERWRDLAPEELDDEKLMRRFLGDVTKQEVLDQLRRSELVERITADVIRKAGGGERGRKAVLEFQDEFSSRWRDRSACKGPGLPTGLCPR
jgi:hypothetical protein